MDRGPPDRDQAHVGKFVFVDLISEIQWLGLNHATSESWSDTWQLADPCSNGRNEEGRWIPHLGDRGPLLLCDVVPSESSNFLKENERPRLDHEIPL